MSELEGDEKKRAWTLAGARELLADVRERTERAVLETERLQAIRDDEGASAEEKLDAEQQMSRCVSRWIREMEAFGLEIRGAWLVDFDNGSGYYCWRWPEESLDHFHGYDEGYDSRVRIQ